ncbi:MAG: NADH-quinone oxidoreductase subunit A [Bacteroidota bacterium]
MLTEFGRILIFLIVGVGFVGAGLAVARFIRPHRPYPGKLATYECGEAPLGDTRIRFNVRFYVVALVFLVFDVEVVLLFPWAVVFGELGWPGFVEMLVFLGILFVGYAAVWRKGDLDWDKPSPRIPRYAPGLGVVEPRVAGEEPSP